MTTFNPLSVRAFVGHTQLQRKSRARFRVAAGILLSLLLHGALLWYALSADTSPPLGASSPIQAPLMVTLLQSKPKPSANAPSPNPPEPVRSNAMPKPSPSPRTSPQKAAKRSAPKAKQRSATPPLPQTHTAQQAQQSRSEAAPPAADMSSMLDAARARRQAAQGAAESDDTSISRESHKAPSGNEVAQANIDFSLRKNQGISGVFQILSIGPRIGIFRFIGWTADASNNTRQTLTVDAGLGGNVQEAIVNRMIQLIREHYKENFNWDSHRLGRIMVLSARKKDEDELRRFLVLEFFEGPRY